MPTFEQLDDMAKAMGFGTFENIMRQTETRYKCIELAIAAIQADALQTLAERVKESGFY